MGGKGNAQITEIAERLGLSAGTVSIVLNGRGDKMRISKATQKKVKEAAKEMGYQPNIYDRRLRSAGTEETGQVIAVFWNSGYADEIMGGFFRGLQRTAVEKGYHAEFYVHMFEYGQLAECEAIMTPTRFSGIIICGISDVDADFLNSHTFQIPVVCVYRHEKRYHSVYVDDYSIGVNAAKLFAQRGHTSVGFIGSTHNGPNSVLRKMGFLNKSFALGLKTSREYIREEEGRDFLSGYEAMKQLLALENPPTAIFVNIPEQAIGAVSACKAKGIIFQKELELLSMGISKSFDYFMPTISTIYTPVEEAGESALNLLMVASHGDVDMPISRVLEAKCLYGDTCGGIS